MDELPENWIDKLFDAMHFIYGHKWSLKLGNPRTVELHKTIWFNSLSGVSYAEIKNGLVLCKRLAKIDVYGLPSNIQFYHYCKNIPYPNLHVLRRTYRKTLINTL